MRERLKPMSKLVSPNDIKDAAVAICGLPAETTDWSDEDWTMFGRFCAVNIQASAAHASTKVIFLVFGAPPEWTDERIDELVSKEIFRLVVAALREEIDDEDPR